MIPLHSTASWALILFLLIASVYICVHNQFYEALTELSYWLSPLDDEKNHPFEYNEIADGLIESPFVFAEATKQLYDSIIS